MRPRSMGSPACSLALYLRYGVYQLSTSAAGLEAAVVKIEKQSVSDGKANTRAWSGVVDEFGREAGVLLQRLELFKSILEKNHTSAVRRVQSAQRLVSNRLKDRVRTARQKSTCAVLKKALCVRVYMPSLLFVCVMQIRDVVSASQTGVKGLRSHVVNAVGALKSGEPFCPVAAPNCAGFDCRGLWFCVLFVRCFQRRRVYTATRRQP